MISIRKCVDKSLWYKIVGVFKNFPIFSFFKKSVSLLTAIPKIQPSSHSHDVLQAIYCLYFHDIYDEIT